MFLAMQLCDDSRGVAPAKATCAKDKMIHSPALGWLENRNSYTGHWFALLAFIGGGSFIFYTSQATQLSRKKKRKCFQTGSSF